MGQWLGFAIWLFCGAGFVGMGIYIYRSRKEMPFGFFANVSVAAIADVKKYNHALGKLWIVFGAVFILLGIPLVYGQNSAGVVIPILGAMAECIVAAAVYTIRIEGKYRKK